MKKTLRIGLIGDYNRGVGAHLAIPKALALAGARLGGEVSPSWVQTGSLDGKDVRPIADFDGLWCVPGSPYANMAGALHAIRFAREHQRPFLGTCGGFQHAVIEFARNVLGLIHADHTESSPETEWPLITRLSCSLVGTRGRIRFVPGSRAAQLYGVAEADEQYHCNFGINPDYLLRLKDSQLRISGLDENQEPRVIELEGHPFFMGTLFQPELSASGGIAHPLIVGFVRAAGERSP